MRFLLPLLIVLFCAACAGSVLDEFENEDNGPGQGHDAGIDTSSGDNDQPGDPDTGSPDDPDTGEPPLCDGVTCSNGICDPDTGECVECLDDNNCSGDLSCDPLTNTCLGCVDDVDCPGDAQCHDQYPTCVDACCDFSAEEAFSHDLASWSQFVFALDSEGDPSLLTLRQQLSQPSRLYYSVRTDSGWLTEELGEYNSSITANMAFEFDAQDEPHFVFRYFNHWTYWRRDGSTWIEEDVWDEEISSGHTDMIVEDDGTVHVLGVLWNEVHYARRSPGGTWERETYVAADEDYNLTWMVADQLSDGSIVVSLGPFFVPGGPRDLDIAIRTPSGWAQETIAEGVNQIHDMSVTSDDEILVVHRAEGSSYEGLELTGNGSGQWSTEILTPVSVFDYRIAIDLRDDPHFAYTVSAPDEDDSGLRYHRWDGSDWEVHTIADDLVGSAGRHHIAVDEEYRPHIVVFDSSLGRLRYLTVH